jgi:hypothetical protein
LSKPWFPKPTSINRRNFWRRGTVRQWAAEALGRARPEPRDDDEQLITQRAVRELLGGVSDMWIWRHREPSKARRRKACTA